MKPLGCLGLVAAFSAGCVVTYSLLSLRPLADPVGQLMFQREEQDGTGMSDQIADALRAITASITTESPMRVWTHRDGRKVRATLINATSNTATIKREQDGRVFTISQNMLSTDDREFIQRWIVTHKGGKPAELE